MSDMDLSLVGTEDLLDEVFKRHDHAIFTGIQVHANGPDKNNCRRSGKGNTHTCIGLAAHFQAALLEQLRKTEHPESA